MRLALVLAVASTALAPGAWAGNARDCAAQGEVVAAVVAARQGGASAEAAGPQVSGALKGRAADYAPALPYLVEWVYSLEPAQLGPAVAESYEAACRAQ